MVSVEYAYAPRAIDVRRITGIFRLEYRLISSDWNKGVVMLAMDSKINDNLLFKRCTCTSHSRLSGPCHHRLGSAPSIRVPTKCA